MDRIKIANGESNWKRPEGFVYIPKGIKLKKVNLNVHAEFDRWKKTDDCRIWKRKQYLKQGGLCWYCGCFLKGVRINIEHKTARSLGGRNNKGNLVLSCSYCNKEKGSKVLTAEERAKYNRQNKKNKGTYLKNRAHWEANVYPYTDDGFYDMIRNF